MKRTTPILMLVLMLLLTAWMMPATAEENPTLLTLYEGPKTMTTSATAKVTANGNDLFVYDVMVNHEHIWNANTQPTTTPMTYFDFEGKVRIEVEMPGLPDKVESAAVIPQSWGITPEVKDGKVSFMITEPGQYTVVFNDNVNKALHIFANPLETDVPDPDDPNVYYIPSGEWAEYQLGVDNGSGVEVMLYDQPNYDGFRTLPITHWGGDKRLVTVTITFDEDTQTITVSGWSDFIQGE